ncbi:MAG: hypothetical protein LBM09_02630 [Candidatus Nomurabacteria bacterium]|jgi:hypothetical protein|nr:hypothetical protein [Candidatus Nomurabacteria bacterium]
MTTRKDGIRVRQLETTREIALEQWIVTNPIQIKGDYPNNYMLSNETFIEKYDRTDIDGVYQAKNVARIIKNDIGAPVEIMAPWGWLQRGDENCYFEVDYNPDNIDEIGSDRYIISENDFATYKMKMPE